MSKRHAYHSVYFDVVGFCNAKCPWCQTGNGSLKQYPPKYIRVDDFRQAIDRLKDSGFIDADASLLDLFSWGEPMLHPQLNAILRILTENGLAFGLSTNASRFVALESDALANLRQLRFSVPGFSQSSYDRIHGFNFHIVLKNIEAFCDNVHRERPDAKLEMVYHLYQFNIDEVPAARDFCRANGIEFYPFFAYLCDFDLTMSYLDRSVRPELLRRMTKDLFLYYVDGLLAQAPRDYQCPQHSILTIDEECNILTCCFLPKDHPEYSLGKISTLSLDDVRKGKISQMVCRECIASGAAYWVHNPVVPGFLDLLTQSSRITELETGVQDRLSKTKEA